MKTAKVMCKTCKKETEHESLGNDIPESHRWMCKVCKTCNKKKD